MRAPLLAATTAFVLSFAVLSASAQSGGDAHKSNEAAIRLVIADWDQAWRDFDADLAARDYAENATWTNSFGESTSGRDGIHHRMASLYQNPGARSRHSTPSSVQIDFIRPDAAIVTSYRETVGQRNRDGSEMPTRKTHDLRVIVLENGRWLIRSHFMVDERNTAQP